MKDAAARKKDTHKVMGQNNTEKNMRHKSMKNKAKKAIVEQ